MILLLLLLLLLIIIIIIVIMIIMMIIMKGVSFPRKAAGAPEEDSQAAASEVHK